MKHHTGKLQPEPCKRLIFFASLPVDNLIIPVSPFPRYSAFLLRLCLILPGM